MRSNQSRKFTCGIAVDGQGIVRSILPTIPHPSTTIPRLPPDTRRGGQGHVRCLRLPGHHPRAQPQPQAHTRLPTRFRLPPMEPGHGGRGFRRQPCGGRCVTGFPGKSSDGLPSSVSVWVRAGEDRAEHGDVPGRAAGVRMHI